MEISESFAMPLVTVRIAQLPLLSPCLICIQMVRRAGRFQAPNIVEFPPQEGDTGEALESKWRNWTQQESFKRYVLTTQVDPIVPD